MATTKKQYMLNIPIDVGDGPQTIVYFHGINGNGQSFQKVIDRLNLTGRRVVAPDMLGYGASPKPLDINYSIDDHVEAAHFTLKNLGIKKPFILIGYSMGGVIAPRYAKKYPEDVSSLILISAPFYLKPQDMVSAHYVRSIFATKFWNKLWDWSRNLSIRHKRAFRYLSSENVKFVQGVINSGDLAVDWPIFQKCIKNTISKSTISQDLSKIKIPTTFVTGKKDIVVVNDQLDALKRYKPDIEIRRISTIKADHFVLDNLPGQIASEIERAVDIKLHIQEDRGRGEAIIFLHGVEGSADYWHSYVNLLHEKYRVISLDLLGFGRSSKPLNIAYTLEDQTKYLEAAFKKLGIKKATLVGHSLGALVALGFAARQPRLVKKLVLFEPVIVARPSGKITTVKNFNQLKNTALNNLDSFRQKVQVLMQKNIVRDVLGEENLQNYLPALRSIENVVEKQNVALDLKKLEKMPISVVFGGRDPMVSEENIKRLASKFKNLTIVKVRAGHNAPLERPVESTKAIDSAITDLEVKKHFNKKQQKSRSDLQKTLRKNMVLLMFRGLINLGFGLGIVFGNYPARLLVIGVVVFVFINSLTILTQSITLRNEMFNWVLSAVMGLIGLCLGIYLMLSPKLSLEILFTVAGLYLLGYGIISVLLGVAVKNGLRPTWQMFGLGFTYVVVGILLLAQNKIGIVLTVLAIAIISAISGVILISYAAVTYLLSRNTAIKPKYS